MAMPLCRTSDDLHPKQYGQAIWNGTIACQMQKAEQRQPPPSPNQKALQDLQGYDRVHIKREARRLGTFTIPELHHALRGDYTIATLENELSHWKNLRQLPDPRRDTAHHRYRYWTIEDEGQQRFPIPPPQDAA
jgi:hypothetical protein